MGLDGYRNCLSRLQLQSWISAAGREATLTVIKSGIPETGENVSCYSPEEKDTLTVMSGHTYSWERILDTYRYKEKGILTVKSLAITEAVEGR